MECSIFFRPFDSPTDILSFGWKRFGLFTIVDLAAINTWFKNQIRRSKPCNGIVLSSSFFSYEEDKNTCQCNSIVGQSIFYRTLGLIADWDKSEYWTSSIQMISILQKILQNFIPIKKYKIKSRTPKMILFGLFELYRSCIPSTRWNSSSQWDRG